MGRDTESTACFTHIRSSLENELLHICIALLHSHWHNGRKKGKPPKLVHNRVTQSIHHRYFFHIKHTVRRNSVCSQSGQSPFLYKFCATATNCMSQRFKINNELRYISFNTWKAYSFVLHCHQDHVDKKKWRVTTYSQLKDYS